MASTTTTARVRRKPVPKLALDADADSVFAGDNDASVKDTVSVRSYALYPDPPMSSLSSATSLPLTVDNINLDSEVWAAPNAKRASFALYPDPPMPPFSSASGSSAPAFLLPGSSSASTSTSTSASTSTTSPMTTTSTMHTPHYTRRRANTTISSISPSTSTSGTVATPAPAQTHERRGLARLLLSHAHLPHSHSYHASASPSASSSSSAASTSASTPGSTPSAAPSTAGAEEATTGPTAAKLRPRDKIKLRVRKHTISTPLPAPFPPALLPPGLAPLLSHPPQAGSSTKSTEKAKERPSAESHGVPSALFGMGVGVPPLALQVSASSLVSPVSSRSASSASSGSASSSARTSTSGETSPPVSPLSPFTPTSPMCESPMSLVSPITPITPVTLGEGEGSTPLKRRSSAGTNKIVKRRPSQLARVGVPAVPSSTSSGSSLALPGANTASSSTSSGPSSASVAAFSNGASAAASSSLLSAPSSSTNRTVDHGHPSPALAPLPAAALLRAARLPVVAPGGEKVLFGDLLSGVDSDDTDVAKRTRRTRRTLAIFLRHFWCPLCQDYLVALARGVGAAHAASLSLNSASASTFPITKSASAATSGAAMTEESEQSEGKEEGTLAMPASLSSLFEGPMPEDEDDAQGGEGEEGEGEREEEENTTAENSVTLSYLESCSREIGEASTSTPPLDSPSPATPASDPPDDDEETEMDTEIHLLLISPGAHTLAERYLTSFGFPRALTEGCGCDSSASPSEVPPAAVRTEDGDGCADKEGKAKGASGIASIRLFVDPHPAEGVYAALGMGWTASAIGGSSASSSAAASPAASANASRVASPAMSPTVPRFARREMPASPTGAMHGHGYEHGDEEREGVRFEGLSLVGSSKCDDINKRHSALDAHVSFGEIGAARAHTDDDHTHALAHDDPHAAPASYVTHGIVSGIGAVLLRALRTGMPVWERGGDIKLLGGEFVFECGPGNSSASSTDASTPELRCTYAHRMQTMRGHASVARVLAAAGVRVPPDSHNNERGHGTTRTTERDAQRLGRSISRSVSSSFIRSLSMSRATSTSALQHSVSVSAASRGKGKGEGGMPRSKSFVNVRQAAPVADTKIETHDERASIPRSASTPPTAGMFSTRAAGNMFTRFAGPRGGRAMKKTERARAEEGLEPIEGEKDKDAQDEERPRIPRSASTPPMSIAGSGTGGGHDPHWGGVIWEGEDAGASVGKGEEERESAIPTTLSASSSRPWALMAAAGSSVSLASDSSDDSAIVFKAIVPRRAKTSSGSEGSATTTSSASASAWDLEPGFGSSGSGSEGLSGYRMYYAGSEDGDDERSGSGSEGGDGSRRRGDAYPFPHSVSEHGPGHVPPMSGLVRRGAKFGYGHGYARALSEYALAPEGEEDEEEYAHGYSGDGYGSPVDGEDAWMRARARSLARLRARKEARRGAVAEDAVESLGEI
ncbi:hypothetical protein MSAN_00333400 [Mycena sanguinolenta]|uniref:Uncharacterized protein n=1 Tax=Mycena sanguinolenta TaxID=230812 RepID=A0A8H6Z8H8_9AGAR|nr:hypothetical protein MSAN_00333400 [Mycena sanguinolenta]